jgi:hypothetical protein
MKIYAADITETIDKSTNPTVVEYAVREMMKGKSPKAAANATVKKLAGGENMLLGPGVTQINPEVLEKELWKRLVDFTIKSMSSIKPGFEHYALDGALQQFNQNIKLRDKIKALVIEKLGNNPFKE